MRRNQDRQIARAAVQIGSAMRDVFPDAHFYIVLKNNGDGTLQVRLAQWGAKEFITVVIRSNSTIAEDNITAGMKVRVDYEEGDRNLPYVTAVSGVGKLPTTPVALWSCARGNYRQNFIADGIAELANIMDVLRLPYLLDYNYGFIIGIVDYNLGSDPGSIPAIGVKSTGEYIAIDLKTGWRVDNPYIWEGSISGTGSPTDTQLGIGFNSFGSWHYHEGMDLLIFSVTGVSADGSTHNTNRNTTVVISGSTGQTPDSDPVHDADAATPMVKIVQDAFLEEGMGIVGDLLMKSYHRHQYTHGTQLWIHLDGSVTNAAGTPIVGSDQKTMDSKQGINQEKRLLFYKLPDLTILAQFDPNAIWGSNLATLTPAIPRFAQIVNSLCYSDFVSVTQDGEQAAPLKSRVQASLLPGNPACYLSDAKIAVVPIFGLQGMADTLTETTISSSFTVPGAAPFPLRFDCFFTGFHDPVIVTNYPFTTSLAVTARQWRGVDQYAASLGSTKVYNQTPDPNDYVVLNVSQYPVSGSGLMYIIPSGETNPDLYLYDSGPGTYTYGGPATLPTGFGTSADITNLTNYVGPPLSTILRPQDGLFISSGSSLQSISPNNNSSIQKGWIVGFSADFKEVSDPKISFKSNLPDLVAAATSNYLIDTDSFAKVSSSSNVVSAKAVIDANAGTIFLPGIWPPTWPPGELLPVHIDPSYDAPDGSYTTTISHEFLTDAVNPDQCVITDMQGSTTTDLIHFTSNINDVPQIVYQPQQQLSWGTIGNFRDYISWPTGATYLLDPTPIIDTGPKAVSSGCYKHSASNLVADDAGNFYGVLLQPFQIISAAQYSTSVNPPVADQVDYWWMKNFHNLRSAYLIPTSSVVTLTGLDESKYTWRGLPNRYIKWKSFFYCWGPDGTPIFRKELSTYHNETIDNSSSLDGKLPYPGCTLRIITTSSGVFLVRAVRLNGNTSLREKLLNFTPATNTGGGGSPMMDYSSSLYNSKLVVEFWARGDANNAGSRIWTKDIYNPTGDLAALRFWLTNLGAYGSESTSGVPWLIGRVDYSDYYTNAQVHGSGHPPLPGLNRRSKIWTCDGNSVMAIRDAILTDDFEVDDQGNSTTIRQDFYGNGMTFADGINPSTLLNGMVCMNPNAVVNGQIYYPVLRTGTTQTEDFYRY